jgi:hypothetical protein
METGPFVPIGLGAGGASSRLTNDDAIGAPATLQCSKWADDEVVPLAAKS